MPIQHRLEVVEVHLTQPSGRWVLPRDRLALSRLVLQVIAVAVLVVSLIGVGGAQASRRAAENESIAYASRVTDLLAEGVVQPVLTDDVLSGDPAELSRLDMVLRQVVGTGSIVRVKVFAADGKVVYSDAGRLIGARFPLDPNQRYALAESSTWAEFTDISQPEDRSERDEGPTVEVYRPVRTADGTPLLFETYSRYADVTIRARQLWFRSAGIVLATLLAAALFLVPLGWAMSARLRNARQRRERALADAVEASDNERRRIAGGLHDGVVQELSAISFMVSNAADRASGIDEYLAERLRGAAGGVRASLGGLRSLLVEVYPTALRASGLAAALGDLAGMLRLRGIDVELDLVDPAGLDARSESLAFRIAQEIIRNIGRHAGARSVCMTLICTPSSAVLTVTDDGVGFDPVRVVAATRGGNFGLAMMTDLATEAGAHLCVSSAPGRGTRWCLAMPNH